MKVRPKGEQGKRQAEQPKVSKAAQKAQQNATAFVILSVSEVSILRSLRSRLSLNSALNFKVQIALLKYGFFAFLQKAQNDKFRAFVFESSLKMTSFCHFDKFVIMRNDKFACHTERSEVSIKSKYGFFATLKMTASRQASRASQSALTRAKKPKARQAEQGKVRSQEPQRQSQTSEQPKVSKTPTPRLLSY